MENVKEIGLIGDCHHGKSGGSHDWRTFQKKHLFDTLEYYRKRNITQVVECGDFWDTRRYVLGLDWHWMLTELIPYLDEHGMTIHSVIGNHCISLRDSIEINHNRILELASKGMNTDCIKVYENPTDVVFGDTEVLFLPWVCDSNMEEVLDSIEKSTASVVIGHLELAGFLVSPHTLLEHGTMCTSLFEKFDKVYSGHLHIGSEKKLRSGTEVKFIGTPYAQNWGEYDHSIDNGVYVMDCLTTELEFIPNRVDQEIFNVIEYDYENIESEGLVKEYLDVDYLSDTLGLKGSVVRVEVVNKDNSSHYKKFIACLRLVNCINFTTKDLTNEVETVEIEVTENEWKASTIEVLIKKAESTEGIHHNKVVEMLKSSHQRCLDKSNLV